MLAGAVMAGVLQQRRVTDQHSPHLKLTPCVSVTISMQWEAGADP